MPIMQHKEDIGWLDIGTEENSRLAVIDNGRLRSIVSHLEDPERQYPSICAFLGGRTKDRVLQQIYPWNNIKRHVSSSKIRLRYDVASLGRMHPVLFADGEILHNNRSSPLKRLSAGVGRQISWRCGSAQLLLSTLWERLVFLFTDVVCIFVDDFPETDDVVDLLMSCSLVRSASSLSPKLLPKVIIISGETKKVSTEDMLKRLRDRILHETGSDDISESFSEIRSIELADNGLSVAARYQPIRALVAEQLDAMRTVREVERVQPNGKHLMYLFQAAFQHMLTDIETKFNLVNATREVYAISPYLESHLIHYLDIGNRAGLASREITSTIAGALLMDNYVPGMLVLEPSLVFRAFYRSAILGAYRERADYWPNRCPEEQAAQVESHLVFLFDVFTRTNEPSVELRKTQLESQSGRLCRIRSNKICLYCLFQNAQHILSCGHTLCDHCVRVFGTPTKGLEHQFTIRGCIYCLYQRPLVVDTLPPTMSPSVLAIDGGGVRGVIPLEFLLLVQEHLRPCLIQDVVDLALGTSSGGLIAIGLFVMSWDVSDCSQIFEDLARRIFQDRRRSPFFPLNFIHTQGSTFGEIGRWIHWLLHDSCYDSRDFDTALKSAFGEHRRMFGVSRDDPRGALRSNSKIGVVTTSISRATEPFVVGNFNVAPGLEEKGVRILRPPDATDEPSVWRAARATAAAPFFFTPADLPGIGSFQDGGLKHNFAGEIANQMCHRIWPDALGSTRLVSLGTGIAQAAVNATPHFRHIFRDSFIRRGFDAWMSTLDTEGDWSRMRSQLDAAVRSDYHRLNVELEGTSNTIDSVETMEEYRNLVLCQPGSSRRAREAATTLLVSRFYFELSELPENVTTPFWCRGVVRCKGSAQNLILALGGLYPEGLTYTSSDGIIDAFEGLDELCSSCGSYAHRLSFLVRHIDHQVDVFLQSRPGKRWRLSGFPETLASFALRQGITSSFGHREHGLPSRGPCDGCDVIVGSSNCKRRRRESTGSKQGSKKVCLVGFERNPADGPS